MKVSVVIPAFNCQRTIAMTIDSVLSQNVSADEILVMNDGSIDTTPQILRGYGNRITVFEQPNSGVANARNSLVRLAQGDLIAFIDSDDLWHPDYLRTQRELFRSHPQGVAFFTNHIEFEGYSTIGWEEMPENDILTPEVLDPAEFLIRYHIDPYHFSSMSFCCIPKKVLQNLAPLPFCPEVAGADDFALLNTFPLFGSVVYSPMVLAAYRVISEAYSANRLKITRLVVRSLELLEPLYKQSGSGALLRNFQRVYASNRRYLAKILMSTGEKADARQQIRLSFRNNPYLGSVTKSLGLLTTTFLPSKFQPSWPPAFRGKSALGSVDK